MAQDGVTFGYVIPTVPRGFPDEVMADPSEATRALMAGIGRAIEAVRGHFGTVWVEDHFQWGGNRPVLEALSTLCYLAARYERMRFGTIVLGQGYRNPALVAKMGAILQALTGGNFILGIGAGWKEDEYRAYGYPYPPDGERIEQLEEAVQIIRAMWTQSPASFEGKHYRIENADCEPRPNPPIPSLIGGGGEKKTLRVAAKYADWWTAPVQSLDEYAHKQRVLAGHCRAIGRDPAEITHTFCARVSVVEHAADAYKGPGRYVISGTPDMVTRELEQLITWGVKHFQLSFFGFPHTDDIELFINRVLPRLGV